MSVYRRPPRTERIARLRIRYIPSLAATPPAGGAVTPKTAGVRLKTKIGGVLAR